jgi:hypothetical protein
LGQAWQPPAAGGLQASEPTVHTLQLRQEGCRALPFTCEGCCACAGGWHPHSRQRSGAAGAGQQPSQDRGGLEEAPAGGGEGAKPEGLRKSMPHTCEIGRPGRAGRHQRGAAQAPAAADAGRAGLQHTPQGAALPGGSPLAQHSPSSSSVCQPCQPASPASPPANPPALPEVQVLAHAAVAGGAGGGGPCKVSAVGAAAAGGAAALGPGVQEACRQAGGRAGGVWEVAVAGWGRGVVWRGGVGWGGVGCLCVCVCGGGAGGTLQC